MFCRRRALTTRAKENHRALVTLKKVASSVEKKRDRKCFFNDVFISFETKQTKKKKKKKKITFAEKHQSALICTHYMSEWESSATKRAPPQ